MQPHATSGRDRFDGCIGAQGNEFGGLVVRQPDLHALRAGGECGEQDVAEPTGACTPITLSRALMQESVNIVFLRKDSGLVSRLPVS